MNAGEDTPARRAYGLRLHVGHRGVGGGETHLAGDSVGPDEREVEHDIYALARDDFGVEKHWHKRIVHAGVNGLATARENPPVLTIANDDLVFVDLGPVFDEWEADVGRSYVVGNDPDKVRLVADLSAQFDAVQARPADPGEVRPSAPRDRTP